MCLNFAKTLFFAFEVKFIFLSKKFCNKNSSKFYRTFYYQTNQVLGFNLVYAHLNKGVIMFSSAKTDFFVIF